MTNLLQITLKLAVTCVLARSQEWAFTGINIALNKPTEQRYGVNKGMVSSRAVDGNTNAYPLEGSCAHTAPIWNSPSYWSVDLAGVYILKGIQLYNRFNIRYRLRNFQIIGYPSGTILHDDSIAARKMYILDVINITVDSETLFSNITVQVPTKTGYASILTVCEVQIYSVANDCSTAFQEIQLEWILRHGTGYWNPTNALVSSGAVIDFYCTGSYELHGVNSSQCRSNGLFDEEIPKCIEIRCDAPGGINNGYYTEHLNTTYSVGDTITWQCVSGYKPIGTGKRQCMLTRAWSGNDPQCTLITCAYPIGIQNISLAFNNDTSYISGNVASGTAVKVTCEKGYETHVSTITCTVQETWDSLPVCTIVECQGLPAFTGGYYKYDGTSNENENISKHIYGTVATVVCGTNYTLHGEERRECDKTGEWTGTAKTCVAVCLVPLLQNGHYLGQDKSNFSQYETGHSISPACVEGYEVTMPVNVFELSRKCLANHTWDGQPVNCTRVVQKGSTGQTWLTSVAAGGGTAAGVVVLAVICVVVLVVLRRRKKKEDPKFTSDNVHNNPVICDDIKNAVIEDMTMEDNVYVNAVDIHVTEDVKDTYYNLGETPTLSRTAIQLSKLAEVVLAQGSTFKRFSEEYEAFPEGMTKPHTKALKDRSKNKYRSLYAYDETRVVLDIWDEKKDTDYINACYINGFSTPKDYIASQGPIKANLNDFWRMVWQTNSGKIVMLTNIMEEGKTKCIKYWPDSGSENYGHIKVTLTAVDNFSNFVVRTLLLTKTGEPQRRIQQFHFTTWPDRDVPAFTSSLVHFRDKVKAATSACAGPIVVHCSAGIGRTGTYIAIDYLVDQAKELGYVDVVGCVETLRGQRVNMVQKESQYVFVHLALVEILVMNTSVISTSGFLESYRQLLDTAQGQRKLDVEFDMLWKMTPKQHKAESGRNEDLNEENGAYQDVNPVKEFMPSYSETGRGRYDKHINAAFLPMYKEDDAMIIAQAPVESGMEDFWNLVYHQDVRTIVMMNHVTQLRVKDIYWPDANHKVTHGKITISNTGDEQKRSHTVVQLHMVREKIARDIQLIQFGRWDAGNLIPDDPRHLLSALDLVESNQRDTGNHPIVVHCMDGVERSGLFCVVAAVLDRTKIEQDVAITQVIQEMRNRRKNVIPNVEQFEFCHEAVSSFLQKYETYSNFTF